MSKSKNTVRNAKLAALANAVKRKNKNKKKPRMSSMGPVAAISTAPVAIGNSIKGSKSSSVNTKNGCVVRGRDFMFTPVGSGSITTWTMVGGTPLAPAAFADSVIREYVQMYQKFRWRKCVVYYITSSPTSANGDVCFYYGKNRNSVFLNQTSSALLQVVLSDSNTVLGPQWTNHAATLELQSTWKSTDYGMSDDIDDFSAGEIFLLSKTSTTDSPGYVIFDYEIEFAELQISPRLLNLPLPRCQYFNTVLSNSGAKTQSNNADLVIGTGTNISGSAAALPANAAVGDIYKVIFDATNSTFTTGTASQWLQIGFDNGQNTSLTITDGLTLYGVIDTSTTMMLYLNTASAYALGQPLQWGATLTFSGNIQIWVSLIGTVSNVNLKPNY